VNPRVERHVGPHERLETHRSADVDEPRERRRIVDQERRQRRHHVGAVQERQSLLHLEDQRWQPRRPERLPRRPAHAADHRVALADEARRDVGQWGKVAGCPHGPAAGHHRQDAVLETSHQPLDHHGTDAGVTAGQRRGEQQEHRASLLGPERVADSGRVRQDEIPLKGPTGLGGNCGVFELPDAGGDAVDHFAGPIEPFEGGTASLEPVHNLGAEPHGRGAAGHRDHVGHRECAAQSDHRRSAPRDRVNHIARQHTARPHDPSPGPARRPRVWRRSLAPAGTA
jgi:hypothetical protein